MSTRIEIPLGFTEEHVRVEGHSRSLWQSERAVEVAYGRGQVTSRVKVTVVPEGEGDWWGWYAPQGPGSKKLHFILESLAALNVCFAYGTKPEEDRGQGRVVQLRVEKAQ